MIRSRRTMKNWYSSSKLYFGLNLIVIIGLLLSMVGLASLPPAQPAAAAGGDFSLDFTAAGPSSYDHSTGGGAYNDRTIDKSYGVVESLEGGDYFCGDIVTFLTAITVGGDGSDDPQTVQIDFTFGAQPTGQPGVGFVDVTNVAVNYGPVENGGGGGAGTFGLDTGINDDRQTISGDTGTGGSTAVPISEAFDPPGTVPFGTPPNDADYVLLTVEVDDLEAGEQVILRVDVRLGCDDDPSTSPTGNVHSTIDSAGVVIPVQDSINVGVQTITLKNPGAVGQPSLTITKSWQDLNGEDVEPGDIIRYTINYANNGDADATGVYIVDDYDQTAFTIISNFQETGAAVFGTTPDDNGSRLRWPSAGGTVTLSAGASGSVSYDATLTDPFPSQPVRNVACIDTNETDPLCDEVIIEEPKLWIDKSWLDINGGAVEPGDIIQYTINYGNNGNADATGVYIVDDYDQTAFTTISNITNGGFVTHNDNGDTIRWPSGTGSITLTPGASGSVTYDATLTDPFPSQPVRNVACIDTNETDPLCDDTTIEEPKLWIDKSWQDLNGGKVEPGDTIQYTIEYGNNGNADATGVYIVDDYDQTAFTTISNITNGGFVTHNDNGDTIRWPSGTGSITLAPGASGSVSYDATLTDPFPSQPVRNVACIDTNETDPLCDDTTIEEPQLWIDKSWQDINGGAVEPGDIIQYTIEYGNNGNADATGVYIVDDYDQTAFTTISNITNGDFPNNNDNGDTIRWPSTGGITLTPGASGSVSYDATLTDPFPSQPVRNVACIEPSDPDVCDDTTIEEPKLWIDKSWLDLNGGAVEPGDIIRYTIDYGNNGNADATGVYIVDDYDQTAFTTISNITNGDFPNNNDNGDTIRWPSTGGITLTPGASGSVTYDATLNAEFPLGTTYVDNTATIDSNETNPVDDDERVVVVVAECETEAFASNNGPVCQGEAVQLFGLPNGMVSYSWTGPQGFFSTQQNPIRSPAVAGTYTLVVTDADECAGVNTTLVVVNPLPDCTITAPSPVSPGSTNTASVTPAGGTYFWSVTGEGTLAGGQNTPSITWTAGDEGTVTISVTVTDANGCQSSCIQTVTVRTPPPPPPPCSPDIQLAVLLDGSSTMNSTEWQTQLDGLSEAILNTECMPDCYVELTVIQFAGEIWGDARTEIQPTVINSDNREDVAQDVLDIVKGGGITPMEAGIDRAVDELRSSPYFRYALKRIINISSDVQENTLDRPAIEEARDNAIAAGITEISAEGVGDFRIPEDQDWMVLNILHPQPGHIAPYSWDPGWVYAVGTDADKFKEAICHKIGLITYTLSTLVSPLGSGSVSPSGGTYDAGTMVSLTATANPGYEFNHWSGTDNDAINPTTVTMNTDKSVTAYFTALGEIRTHTWTFYSAGFFPKHLPDNYTGQVVLADLDPATIPDEVQGVWWYDGAAQEYKFWVPGVGGDLTTLTGQFYNYSVLVTGPCEWEIPLP